MKNERLTEMKNEIKKEIKFNKDATQAAIHNIESLQDRNDVISLVLNSDNPHQNSVIIIMNQLELEKNLLAIDSLKENIITQLWNF